MYKITFLILLLFSSSTHAQDDYTYRSDDEVLIMRVVISSQVIHDGLIAYQYKEGLLLPFSEIINALDLPISISQDMLKAEGWFLQENRRFMLNTSDKTVTIKNKTHKYDPDMLEIHEDDIYINPELLAKWFPFEIDINVPSLTLTVITHEEFPLEKKIMRDIRWKSISKSSRKATADYEHIRSKYYWFDWPYIDNNMIYNVSRDADDNTVDLFQYNVIGVGDMFLHTTEFALNSTYADNHAALNNARFKLSRNIERNTTKSRHAVTAYSIGDVESFSVNMVGQQDLGLGLKLSNYPLDYEMEFDKTTISGDALEGWDVELYHNNTLIDFQTIGPDSHYRFSEIPLHYGMNLYRLVFYGPQGQYRERFIRKNVGHEMVKRGANLYQLSIIDKNNRSTPQVYESAYNGPLYKSALNYRHGLSDRLNLSLSISRQPLNVGTNIYSDYSFLNVGAHVFLESFLTSVEAVANDHQGQGMQLGFNGMMGNIGLVGNFAVFDRYFSDVEGSYNKMLTERVSLRLNGGIRFAGKNRLAYAISSQYRAFDTNTHQYQHTTMLSGHFRRFNVSSNIGYKRSETGEEYYPGSLFMNMREWKNWTINASTNYDYSGDVNNYQINILKKFRPTQSMNFSIKHELDVKPLTTIQLGFSNNIKKAHYSLSLSHRSDNLVSLTFSLSSSMGRNPANGDWNMNSDNLSSSGGFVSRVFLDKNINGVFDDEDSGLEDVRLKVNGVPKPGTYTDDGYLFIQKIPAGNFANVSVDIASLEDPYWQPETEGISYPVRAGRVVNYNFPIYVSGEIDGVVRYKKKDIFINIAKVKLNLMDRNGVIVDSTVTAFDGFYLFTKIKPGEYTVAIDKKQIESLGLQQSDDVPVKIAGDGTIVSGINFDIESE